MMKRCLLVLILCLSGFLYANKASELWTELQSVNLQNAYGGKMTWKQATKGKKLVGVYFSAHWCAPCRKFTPQLVQIRKDAGNDQLEIIFVSLDNNATEMLKYMSETKMPWFALPYAEKKLSRKLQNYFNVASIPTLLIFDQSGNLITRNGVRELQKNGKGMLKVWTKGKK